MIHTFFSPIPPAAPKCRPAEHFNNNPWAVLILCWFLRLGITPPALALWDVDGDSVEDVFLGVTEWTNDTHPSQGNKST